MRPPGACLLGTTCQPRAEVTSPHACITRESLTAATTSTTAATASITTTDTASTTIIKHVVHTIPASPLSAAACPCHVITRVHVMLVHAHAVLVGMHVALGGVAGSPQLLGYP
jgi:hypothetical protein